MIAIPFRVLISVITISFGLLAITVIHVIEIIMVIRLKHCLLEEVDTWGLVCYHKY
jgi:hypothetical protein